LLVKKRRSAAADSDILSNYLIDLWAGIRLQPKLLIAACGGTALWKATDLRSKYDCHEQFG
jgi:hypothetical protein